MKAKGKEAGYYALPKNKKEAEKKKAILTKESNRLDKELKEIKADEIEKDKKRIKLFEVRITKKYEIRNYSK